MTPDKDGWYVWSPGDPKPDADAICDVWARDKGDPRWQLIGGVSGDLNWWETCEYRYRLRTQPIDLSSIKPGDVVTLKPGPWTVIGVTSDGQVRATSGAGFAFIVRPEVIATAIRK